jgi:MarR family transcriptional regulator for hemolysin
MNSVTEISIDEVLPEREITWQLKLSLLIDDIARMQRTAVFRQMRQQTITRTQWWVLMHLHRQNGISQRTLANLMEISEGACTAIIDRMVRGGWIERRADKADRRQNRIFILDAAHDVLDLHHEAMHSVHEEIFIGMTAAEGSKTIEVLNRLRNDLSELAR